MSDAAQPSQPRVITALRLSGLQAVEVLQRLAEWATGVAQLLSGDLRLGVHAACQVVHLRVSTDGGGLGSVTFATRFNQRPSGVMLMACYDSGSISRPIPAYAWSYKGGNIKLDIAQASPITPVTLTALVVLG